MINETTQPPADWESTLPHFSTVEKHGQITVATTRPSEFLTFFAGLTFVLWTAIAGWAASAFYGLSHNDTSPWQFMAMLLCTFVPVAITGILAGEARDTFGQRSTGHRYAVAPALAGCAAGLLGAALWYRGTTGGVLALGSVACAGGAAIATAAAWRGICHTRRRQQRLAALREHGLRSPGVLREVTFLKRWTGDDPEFTVAVDYQLPTGRRTVRANMVAHPSRVPTAGSAVVVFSAPHDDGPDVLIALDPGRPPRFDRDPTGRYRKPSGN